MKRYCSSRAEAALAEMRIKGFARRNFHRAQRRRLALPSAEGPFARCRAASPAHVSYAAECESELSYCDAIGTNLWVAKYKSGGDRSLKQTAAMWPPRVTVKRGCNS